MGKVGARGESETPCVDIEQVDGTEKVTGLAQYVSDIRLPRMVFCRLVLSSVDHGLIRAIRTDRALAVDGVLAIVTAHDLGTLGWIDANHRGQPILADRFVRFAGQSVCAVVAETSSLAQAASRLVDVDYDTLPAVADAHDAVPPGAILLSKGSEDNDDWPLRGLSWSPVAGANIVDRYHRSWGDPEVALRHAAAVFEDKYEFPAVASHELEGPCAIGTTDGSRIDVWSNIGEPFRVQLELARLLRLPLQCVRVVVPYVGGAFTRRRGCQVELLAVALAQRVGRPVQVALPPSEFDPVWRPRLHVAIKTAFDQHGLISMRRMVISIDAGAYVEAEVKWDDVLLVATNGLYPCPNGSIDGALILSHRPPSQAFRGDVAPLLIWAIETHMDRIASQVGVDPMALRRAHFPHRGLLAAGSSVPLPADLDGLLSSVVDGEVRSCAGGGEGHVAQGVAIGLKAQAINLYGCVAIIRLHHDGTVTLSVGVVERGQGVKTVLAHLVAATLGCRVQDVRVVLSDTLLTPYDEGGSGSRSTIVCGRAVQQASLALRRQIIAVAARCWEAPEGDIIISQGRMQWRDQSATFGDLLTQFFGSRGGDLLARGYARDAEPAVEDLGPLSWAAGACRACVRIDGETGEIVVTHLILSADVGRALIRSLCEGQLEGAALMALGHALCEGEDTPMGPMSKSLGSVAKVPTFCNLPDLTVRFIEHADGPGPFGAKGASETGLLAAGAAVANAVRRAAGVRISMPPLTPEQVWRELRKNRAT